MLDAAQQLKKMLLIFAFPTQLPPRGQISGAPSTMSQRLGAGQRGLPVRFHPSSLSAKGNGIIDPCTTSQGAALHKRQRVAPCRLLHLVRSVPPTPSHQPGATQVQRQHLSAAAAAVATGARAGAGSDTTAP